MRARKICRAARLRAAAALFAPVLAGPFASANTDNFTGTTGQDWNTASHWNTNLIPGTNDTVNIVQSPASLFSVNFDTNYTAATSIGSLTLDGGSSFGVQLNQTNSADNLFSIIETVGNGGLATFNQTTATNSISNTLYLGYQSAGSGTYLLSGGSLLSANVTVGNGGHGTLTQSGGTVSISSLLSVGANAGSVGLYSLTGTSSLTITGYERVGFFGTGSFAQSGGTVNSNAWLFVGSDVGGNGTYSLSGTGVVNAPQMSVGYAGTGTFNQSGGTLSSTLFLNVGDQSNGLGTYNLSGGQLNAAALAIGAAATGSSGNAGGNLHQTGGSNSVSGNLTIGSAAGSNGLYSLSGTGVLNATGVEYIGVAGNGTFNQSNGTHTSGVLIYLGYSATGTGTYSLSGGNLNPAQISVGYNGSGAFTQSGGSAVINSLDLGDTSTGSGVYNLSAGSLSSVSLLVGNTGKGTFVQSGGTSTLTAPLIAGNNTGSSGLYSLSGSGVLSTGTAGEAIGFSGSGTFVQSGGTHTDTYWVFLGYNGTGAGSYSLSGGNLNMSGLSAGYNGAGTLSQSGGTASMSSFLTVGDQPTGTGTYILSTGSLSVLTEYISYAGTAVFNQSGGTNTVTGNLDFASQSTGNGTYSLSGTGLLNATGTNQLIGDAGKGTLVQSGGVFGGIDVSLGFQATGNGSYALSGGAVSTGYLMVGLGGSGNFLQTGGTALVGSLQIGVNAGSSGYCSLSSTASLTITTSGEYIGEYGTGTFVQSGGTHTIQTFLELGNQPSGSGTYLLSGSGVVSVAGTVSVGSPAGGTGDLAISSGSMVIGGNLFVFNTPGTSVSLSGGTLTVGSLISYGPPTLFNWTGGTLNLTSPATINSSFALGPSISLGPSQTLIITSSTLTNAGQLTLNGGTLGGNGAVVNSSQMSGNGFISGAIAFTNSGQFSQSGGDLNFSNTGGNTNTGNFLLAGNQLNLTGSGLTNSGSMSLNGTTVNGPATLTNSAAGLISGSGTIAAPLINSGTIIPTNGNLAVPAFTNAGMISPNGATSLLSGGAITNDGYIQGMGSVANAVTNNGTIQPVGSGTLRFIGTVTNPASGFITSSTGNDVIFSQGLPTNAGSISLTGGTVDMNNVAMINTGTISGYGILRTGGLTNNSQIVLSGGTTTLGGSVTNSSGANINIEYSPAVFDSAVTDSSGATIAITNGSATFVSTFTNNGTLTINNTGPAVTTSTAQAVTGTGTMTLAAATSASGNLIAYSVNQNSIVINAGGLLALHGPTQAASVTSQLTQNGNGTLDLGGNGIIVNYTGASPLPAIQAAIATGANGGTYTGPYSSAAITSSAAAANSALAIGYGEASTIMPNGGTFLGANVPAGASAVLARTTYGGDATLDGTVNFSDFLVLQRNFNQAGNWSQGDFTGDGTVNFSDFLVLQRNFNQSYTATPSVQTPGIVTAGHSFPSIQTAGAKTSATSSPSAVALASSKLSPSITVSVKSASSTPNVGTSSPAASTPTVTYVLSINDNGAGVATPGSYAVYAMDSVGDNGGIASYEVNFSGAATISSSTKAGSSYGYYDDGTNSGNDVEIGFSALRKSAITGGINTPNLTGSQDTVGANGVPYVAVYGFGQNPGNLASLQPANSTGLDTTMAHSAQTYNGELLLATGTYTGAAPAFVLNTNGTQNSQGANVWVNSTGTSLEAPTIDLVTQTLPAPEPSSLALMGLGLGGLMMRRRRL